MSLDLIRMTPVERVRQVRCENCFDSSYPYVSSQTGELLVYCWVRSCAMHITRVCRRHRKEPKWIAEDRLLRFVDPIYKEWIGRQNLRNFPPQDRKIIRHKFDKAQKKLFNLPEV